MIYRVINNASIHFYDSVTIQPRVTTPYWTGNQRSWTYLSYLWKFYDNYTNFQGLLKNEDYKNLLDYNEIALQFTIKFSFARESTIALALGRIIKV